MFKIVCYLAITMLFFSIVACEDECEMNDTQCSGQRVEICSSDGEWELLADCAEIVGGDDSWECCEDPDGGFTCLLASECLGAGSD